MRVESGISDIIIIIIDNSLLIFFEFSDSEAIFVLAIRDVAQSGSVLVWGTRGRKFKSCHPDEL